MEQKQFNLQKWSSKDPGLLAFLVDQSHSMSEYYPEYGNKASFTAYAINQCIFNVINANKNGLKVYDRAHIIIIGYGGKGGDSVELIRKGMLSDYANNPTRLEKVKQKISDGDRRSVETELDMPVYLEPVARGCTALGGALAMTLDEIIQFYAQHPNSPDAMIIDVTDGSPWTYEREHKEADYASEMAKCIMDYNTPNGHPLLLHAHIGTGFPKYTYPGPDTVVRGRQANFLSKNSSVLPECYIPIASKFGISLVKGSRGFISNADPLALTNLISFGSSAATLDRMSA